MPYTAFVGGGAGGEGDRREGENQSNCGSVATPQRLRDLALEGPGKCRDQSQEGQTPVWVKGNPEEASLT